MSRPPNQIMYGLSDEQWKLLRSLGFPEDGSLTENKRAARELASKYNTDNPDSMTKEELKIATEIRYACSVVLSYNRNTGQSRESENPSVGTFGVGGKFEYFSIDDIISALCNDPIVAELIRRMMREGEYDTYGFSNEYTHRDLGQPTDINSLSEGTYKRLIRSSGIVFKREDGSKFSLGEHEFSQRYFLDTYLYTDQNSSFKIYVGMGARELYESIEDRNSYHYLTNVFFGRKRMAQAQEFSFPKGVKADKTSNVEYTPANHYLGRYEPDIALLFLEEPNYISPIDSSMLYFDHLRQEDSQKVEQVLSEEHICFFKKSNTKIVEFYPIEKCTPAFYLKYNNRIELSDGTSVYAYSYKKAEDDEPKTMYIESSPLSLCKALAMPRGYFKFVSEFLSDERVAEALEERTIDSYGDDESSYIGYGYAGNIYFGNSFKDLKSGGDKSVLLAIIKMLHKEKEAGCDIDGHEEGPVF